MPVKKMVILILCLCLSVCVSAQTQPKLTLKLGEAGATVSPKLYGLMTEEINYSYDGGLYAELIRNRIFRDNPRSPDHWTLIQGNGGKSKITIDNQQPINTALTSCLRLDAGSSGQRTGIANDGYWGIPVKPSVIYKGSFYCKANRPGNSPLTVSIESKDGKQRMQRHRLQLHPANGSNTVLH